MTSPPVQIEHTQFNLGTSGVGRRRLRRVPTMNDFPTIDPSLRAREGTIDFHGYRVWYACIGEGDELPGRLPLSCLHGGPGAGHDYLEGCTSDLGRVRGILRASLREACQRNLITEAAYGLDENVETQ